MKDTELVCGVDLLYMEDADRKKILFRDFAFTSDERYLIEARKSPLPFSCDTSRLVTYDKEMGTIRFEMFVMAPPPTPFRPPLTVLKICVWVGGRTNTFGLRWPFASTVAQWDRGSDQWIDAGAIKMPPDPPPPPISVFEPVYGLSGGGRALLKARNVFADDALTCDRKVHFPFTLTGKKEGFMGEGWIDLAAIDWPKEMEKRRLLAILSENYLRVTSY